MANAIIYKGKEYPVDENGDFSLGGKFYNAKEAVEFGKAEWKKEIPPQPEPASSSFSSFSSSSSSSSSSDTPYSASTSSSISPEEVYKDQKSPLVVEAAKTLAFPLGAAANDIGDALPEGIAKEVVKKYGVPAGFGIDAALNVLTLSGLGSPAGLAGKTATVPAGSLLKKAADFIPKAMRKGAEVFRPEKTLSQFTKGSITGQRMAEKANATALAMEKNFAAAQAEISAELGRNAKKIKDLGKIANPSPAQQREILALKERNFVLGREAKRIGEQLEYAGKAINSSAATRFSDMAMYRPFLPEATEAAGRFGQRAGAAFLGKNFFIDVFGEIHEKNSIDEK